VTNQFGNKKKVKDKLRKGPVMKIIRARGARHILLAGHHLTCLSIQSYHLKLWGRVIKSFNHEGYEKVTCYRC
jgi:hypothetical protein